MGTGGNCIDAKPKAVWKHQISLMDFRGVNASADRRSADGGVISVQLADPADASPVGNWIKVETVANRYDSQREDNFNVCTFDPIDDGNNEDDFFDPTDPFRRFGPSSTCFPEFVYTYMGDTDTPFDPLNIGNATQGPGLVGAVGVGTWVESVVDLSRFRAQSVRVRMLTTGIKLQTTWQAAFGYEESVPVEDGWFIDDFRVKDAITSPATLEGDVKANVSECSVNLNACVDDTDCAGGADVCRFPQCGLTCSDVTADLVSDPTVPLAAPGQVVELSAIDSTSDRCVGGVLQYRFWIDEDDGGSGSFEPGTDTVLRNWSENPFLLQAPGEGTDYAVDVRCSAATSCLNTAHHTVTVTCPSSTGGPFPEITADGSNNKNDFQWAGPLNHALGEGTLATLSSAYATVASAAGLNGSGHTIGGTDRWLLLRTDDPSGGGSFCNSGGQGPYDGGGAPGRDAGGIGLP